MTTTASGTCTLTAPTMLADRVNMVEGVVSDLQRGHIPNVFAEKGYRADWQPDRPRLVAKCTIALILAAGLYASTKKRRQPRRRLLRR